MQAPVTIVETEPFTELRRRKLVFEHPAPIQPYVALGVIAATAVTDAVYVMFTAAVSGRRRVAAATWSSVWYLLSSFAVISYTRNWIYVVFAALGSWIGAYVSMTLLHKRPARSQSNVSPPFDADRPS